MNERAPDRNEIRRGGYVITPRLLHASLLAKHGAEALGVYSYLVGRASWEPAVVILEQYGSITLAAGQLVAGLGSIEREAGVPRSRLRRILGRLEREGAITRKPAYPPTQGATYPPAQGATHPPSVITISAYETYRPQFWQATHEPTHPASEGGIPPGPVLIKGKKQKKDKETSRPSPSAQDAVRLAEMFWDLVRQNNPATKEPDREVWAREIDRTIRIDGRTPEEIERRIRWTQADSFWRKNVRCPEKLREKFDRLTLDIEDAPRPMRKPGSVDGLAPTPMPLAEESADDRDRREREERVRLFLECRDRADAFIAGHGGIPDDVGKARVLDGAFRAAFGMSLAGYRKAKAEMENPERRTA